MEPGGRTPLHVGLYHLYIQCTNHATMTAKTQDPTSHSNMILKKIITIMRYKRQRDMREEFCKLCRPQMKCHLKIQYGCSLYAVYTQNI